MKLNVESTLDRFLKAQGCAGMPTYIELLEMFEMLQVFISETESQLGKMIYKLEETKEPYPFKFEPFLHNAMRDWYLENPQRSILGKSQYGSNLKHAFAYLFEPLIEIWGNTLTHQELLDQYVDLINGWTAHIHTFDQDVDPVDAEIARISLSKENINRRNMRKAVNYITASLEKRSRQK